MGWVLTENEIYLPAFLTSVSQGYKKQRSHGWIECIWFLLLLFSWVVLVPVYNHIDDASHGLWCSCGYSMEYTGLNLKLALPHVTFVFQCCPVDMGTLIGCSIVDKGQCFKPYFWSTWGFVLGKPRVSKLKDKIVPFAGRTGLDWEGCTSLWLIGGGKSGDSVLFWLNACSDLTDHHLYNSCIYLPTKVKILTSVF